MWKSSAHVLKAPWQICFFPLHCTTCTRLRRLSLHTHPRCKRESGCWLLVVGGGLDWGREGVGLGGVWTLTRLLIGLSPLLFPPLSEEWKALSRIFLLLVSSESKWEKKREKVCFSSPYFLAFSRQFEKGSFELTWKREEQMYFKKLSFGIAALFWTFVWETLSNTQPRFPFPDSPSSVLSRVFPPFVHTGKYSSYIHFCAFILVLQRSNFHKRRRGFLLLSQCDERTHRVFPAATQ